MSNIEILYEHLLKRYIFLKEQLEKSTDVYQLREAYIRLNEIEPLLIASQKAFIQELKFKCDSHLAIKN